MKYVSIRIVGVKKLKNVLLKLKKVLIPILVIATIIAGVEGILYLLALINKINGALGLAVIAIPVVLLFWYFLIRQDKFDSGKGTKEKMEAKQGVLKEDMYSEIKKKHST